ncbi:MULTISPECIES: helix-turn-helix transcriptional regulator [Protofrankia]|uniref:ArsR/SmtB family transcription factor n=1 Tax=Protofrankia TaxID=2994361 RepID=UPI0006407B4D|nr:MULTISPECIES: metalloregulator ArsR/SmtB family transcription factor [Protofrankia]
MSQPDSGARPARSRLVLDEAAAEQVADVMFALSTPSRVQILACLTQGRRSVGELVDELGLEQSSVSHQLRVLREHELVRVERVGRQRMYTLADTEVNTLLECAVRRISGTGETGHGRGRSSGHAVG